MVHRVYLCIYVCGAGQIRADELVRCWRAVQRSQHFRILRFVRRLLAGHQGNRRGTNDGEMGEGLSKTIFSHKFCDCEIFRIVEYFRLQNTRKIFCTILYSNILTTDSESRFDVDWLSYAQPPAIVLELV